MNYPPTLQDAPNDINQKDVIIARERLRITQKTIPLMPKPESSVLSLKFPPDHFSNHARQG